MRRPGDWVKFASLKNWFYLGHPIPKADKVYEASWGPIPEMGLLENEG